VGGFFCPCHGSKFDFSGRVFAGVPAPLNLEVPPYRFVGESTLLIGEDAEVGA
jgi:ubiquinol-cytochrome c reductase iron-sulfur subunit